MLRQATGVGGPRRRLHCCEVGREDFKWALRGAEGILPEDVEVWASLQPVFHSLQLLHAHVRSAAWLKGLSILGGIVAQGSLKNNNRRTTIE